MKSHNERSMAGHHLRILWALIMRELGTRYGRDNLGFLWVIAEPLSFCVGVLILWSAVRSPFEHGLKLVPFIITGYMPIQLVRHLMGHGMWAARVNAPLLYFRQLKTVHLFTARAIVEIAGVTLAFATIVLILMPFGLVEPPQRLELVYAGWALLSVISFGLALVFGALAEIFPAVERIVPVITYILVPLSGTFYMASWLEPQYRRFVLYLPFLHTVEMIRGGFFGEFVPTYYSFAYAGAWAIGLVLLGLVLLPKVRGRLEIG